VGGTIKNTKLISILTVIILGFICMSVINVNNVVTTYKNAESEQEKNKIILIDPGKEKKYEDLNKRVSLKEETKCDIFVSIHLNTFPESYCKGAQVWYSNYEGSERLANIMQGTLKDKLDQSNKRKAKAAGTQYKVLRGNDNMAGVIVECGFLSNPEEYEKLKDEEYQKKIADVLAESISIYLKEGAN